MHFDVVKSKKHDSILTPSLPNTYVSNIRIPSSNESMFTYTYLFCSAQAQLDNWSQGNAAHSLNTYKCTYIYIMHVICRYIDGWGYRHILCSSTVSAEPWSSPRDFEIDPKHTICIQTENRSLWVFTFANKTKLEATCPYKQVHRPPNSVRWPKAT